MNKMTRLVTEFYATVGVPIIYGVGLYLITKADKDFGVNLQIAGLMMTFVGIIMWIKSYRALGSAFGVLPRIQKRVRNGIYRYFQHPMYIGIILTYLGLSLAGGSKSALWYTLLILLPLLIMRANLENKELKD